MILRTMMAVINNIVWSREENIEEGEGNALLLLFLKINMATFTIPYYMYYLVSLSLLFSAHAFYRTLRNTFYTDLEQAE